MKTRGAIIGGVTGLLVLIAIFSLLFAPGGVSFVQNGVQTVVRPIQTGIRNFVSGLERMYDHMHNYDTLEARYQELRDRLAAYERIAREAQGIQEENERLRELLDMPLNLTDVRYIDAHILIWDASNWTSAFTIDRGLNFNIQVDDPVMTERGELVGIVRAVGNTWATVQTIVDPGVSIGGQLGSGVSAVAEGNFALMQNWQLRLNHVPSGEVPLLHDTVTTSGLGGVIPSGLSIGRVIHVAREGTGASYYAIIEPTAELTRLTQVFVIQPIDREAAE